MKRFGAFICTALLFTSLHAQEKGLPSASFPANESYFRENALHLDSGFLRSPAAIRGARSYPVGAREFKTLISAYPPAVIEYDKYVFSKKMSFIMTLAGLVSLVALPEKTNLAVFSGFMFAQIGFTVNAYSHLGKTIWEYNAYIVSLKM